MDIIKVQSLLEIRNNKYPFRNIRETYKNSEESGPQNHHKTFVTYEK